MGRHKARPKREWPTPRVLPQNPPPEHPVVTDHALVRYLQRVIGIDVDALRRQLLADGREELIRTMSSGRLRTADGLTLVVKNRIVVSIIVPGQADP